MHNNVCQQGQSLNYNILQLLLRIEGYYREVKKSECKHNTLRYNRDLEMLDWNCTRLLTNVHANMFRN